MTRGLPGQCLSTLCRIQKNRNSCKSLSSSPSSRHQPNRCFATTHFNPQPEENFTAQTEETSLPSRFDDEIEQSQPPRWQATPPRMKAPFRSKPPPRKPSEYPVNEDPAVLDRVYVEVLGKDGDQVLTEEVKWLAVTHKSFDQGRRGYNDRLAFLGMVALFQGKNIYWLTRMNRETHRGPAIMFGNPDNIVEQTFLATGGLLRTHAIPTSGFRDSRISDREVKSTSSGYRADGNARRAIRAIRRRKVAAKKCKLRHPNLYLQFDADPLHTDTKSPRVREATGDESGTVCDIWRCCTSKRGAHREQTGTRACIRPNGLETIVLSMCISSAPKAFKRCIVCMSKHCIPTDGGPHRSDRRMGPKSNASPIEQSNNSSFPLLIRDSNPLHISKMFSPSDTARATVAKYPASS